MFGFFFKKPDLKDQKAKAILASLVEIALREANQCGSFEVCQFNEMLGTHSETQAVSVCNENNGRFRIVLCRKRYHPVSCVLITQETQDTASFLGDLQKRMQAFFHSSGRLLIDVEKRLIEVSTRANVVPRKEENLIIPQVPTTSVVSGRVFEQMIWGGAAVIGKDDFKERPPWDKISKGVSFNLRNQWPHWPDVLLRRFEPQPNGPFSKTHILIRHICQSFVYASLPNARFCLCECIGDSMDIDGIDGFMIVWTDNQMAPIFVPFDTTTNPSKNQLFIKDFWWDQEKNEVCKVSIVRIFPQDVETLHTDVFAERLGRYLRRSSEQKGVFFPTLPVECVSGISLPILNVRGMLS